MQMMTCFFYMFYKRQRYNNTLINIPWYLGKMFILYEIANFFTTVTGDLVRGTGITGNANSFLQVQLQKWKPGQLYCRLRS